MMIHPDIKKSKYSEGVYFLHDQEWKVGLHKMNIQLSLSPPALSFRYILNYKPARSNQFAKQDTLAFNLPFSAFVKNKKLEFGDNFPFVTRSQI